MPRIPISATFNEESFVTKHQRYDAKRVEVRKEDRRVRPFIAWDGEGVTRDGCHLYTLLANSKGEYIHDANGLDTGRIFSFLVESADRHGMANHVIYGGGYDFNCWLASCGKDEVEGLYKTGEAKIDGFYVAWRQGKNFSITNMRTRRKVIVYDVVSFFQRKFTTACEEYLGENYPHRELIERNKAIRGDFTEEMLSDVVKYNSAELELLVMLMNEFRARLLKVDIFPYRWDGPGTLAAQLMRTKNVKQSLSRNRPTSYEDTPSEIEKAIPRAYAGGRFERFKFGVDVQGEPSLWQYDINSAYPDGLRHVQCMAHGRWVRSRSGEIHTDYGLYYLRYSAKGRREIDPQPLFCRDRNGLVSFPPKVEGWYWGPEARAAVTWARAFNARCTVLDGWYWAQECEHEPFGFIEPLYLKRQALKRAGDGAHVGIKLALNSLYGKLAQQIGYDPTKGIGRGLPPYHQLEWAGYTTAACRAKLVYAMMQNPSGIIATETDAVFSDRPLDLPLSGALGDWEATEYSTLTYLQSGVYFGEKTDGECVKGVAKMRGMNLGSVTAEMVREAVALPSSARNLSVPTRRFIGVGAALMGRWDDWRQWIDSDRIMSLDDNGGKRWHMGIGCRTCCEMSDPYESWGDPSAYGLPLGVWHQCQHGTQLDVASQPHRVIWQERGAPHTYVWDEDYLP